MQIRPVFLNALADFPVHICESSKFLRGRSKATEKPRQSLNDPKEQPFLKCTKKHPINKYISFHLLL